MNSRDKEGRTPIKSLRTYQGDIDELMSQNKDYSATTVLVAEQKRKEERPELNIQEEAGKNEARNKSVFILGSVFLTLGLLIVGLIYYINSREEVQIVQKTKAIIAFTLEKPLVVGSLNREQFLDSLVSEKDSFKQPLNSVLFINTVNLGDIPASTESVLSLIAPNMPSALSRSFSNKYMIGVLSYNTNEIFLILKTDDFASSYAGMLRWEKDMAKDLSRLFGADLSIVSFEKPFVDEELRNKDLRILKSSDGKTTLLYSFIDKNTLVITKNEDIFNAILAKYLTNQNIR